MADCIQAQITADIKLALRDIQRANCYHYNVAAVEQARHTLEINDRYPYILLLENEPVKDAQDDLVIRRLEYPIWFFSEQNDRNETNNTEIAHYNRNAIADITKALCETDNSLTRDDNADATYVIPGTHEYYVDQSSGLTLFGTWCVCVVICDISSRDPYVTR